MGQAITKVTQTINNSKASATADKEKIHKELETIIKVMETKLQTAENNLLQMRLQAQDAAGAQAFSKDIGTGGEVASRVKQMRVVAGSSISKEITEGMNDFFEAAFGLDNSNNGVVNGAKNLLNGAIAGVLGASNGASEEVTSFVCLFVNFTFVRIDYYCYYYSCKAKSGLAEFAKGGFCSLCEVSVIPSESLNIEEANYFMAQSMGPSNASKSDEDVERITEMKMELIESALISRKLKDENISFDEISKLNDFLRKSREKRTARKQKRARTA